MSTTRSQRETLFAAVIAALIFGLASMASGAPSAEQQRQVTEIRTQLTALRAKIAESTAEDARYSGGLIKSLIQSRLATMKLTEALLEQRVASIESGARITFEVPGTTPDLALAGSLEHEIATQKEKIRSVQARSDQYSGGLIKAQIDSTAATMEQTLALLEQRQLVARYGLAMPVKSAGTPLDSGSGASARAPSREASLAQKAGPPISEQVVGVRIIGKRLIDQRYDKFYAIDLELEAIGLDKPARSIKGTLMLRDLFGETKFQIRWTIEQPIAPGEKIAETGSGFKYNRFKADHGWVLSTETQNMVPVFAVESILYADGSRRDF